jgi:flagellar protein FlbT
MPLKIDFKAGDKMVINGAVLENVGPNTKLLIHNESAILREKEVLSVADTTTPASRVYFALQCSYIFPQKKDEYLKVFRKFLKEYVEACPSAKDIALDIEREVADGRIYRALKRTHKLIAHESRIIEGLAKDVSRRVEGVLGDKAPSVRG